MTENRTPAARILRQARNVRVKMMVGRMVESSIGISGAAQLLPLLDYTGLDGSVPLSKDPRTGISIDKGRIRRSESVGSGITFNPEAFSP